MDMVIRKRKSIKKAQYYFCNVNSISRKDIGKENLIKKIDENTIELLHYGNRGIKNGDKIRMYNVTPYALVLTGIYKDGLIKLEVENA